MMTRILRRIGLWPEVPPIEPPVVQERSARMEEASVRLDRLLEAVDAELRGYPGYQATERRSGHDRRREDT